MTPTRPNTVGHVRAPATAGQPTKPVATSANMAVNMAADMATHAAHSAPDMAAATVATTPREPGSTTTCAGHTAVVVATDRSPATTSSAMVSVSARALTCRRLLVSRVSPVVAVVGLLVGLSWCLPAPATGSATHLVSVVVGAWRPARALGAVVLAQQGEAPGSQITLEQFGQNVQWLIIGFLATWTITFFMIGFARMIAARGQSEEYGKAKESLKSSLYGFLGVMLTPALFGALESLFTSRGGR